MDKIIPLLPNLEPSGEPR